MFARGGYSDMSRPGAGVDAFQDVDVEEENDRDTLFLRGVLGRATSMDMSNDSRFFTSNVIDKRVTAISSLVIISTLTLATSVRLLGSKVFDVRWDANWQCSLIGTVQLVGFIGGVLVVILVFTSMFVVCNQLHHIYRLMTSGPTGMELAGMYYLSESILVFRHKAVAGLLSGLIGHMFCTGCVLCVKFIHAGHSVDGCFREMSLQDKENYAASGEGLRATGHLLYSIYAFGALSLGAALAAYIYRVHDRQFAKLYQLTENEQVSTVALSKSFRKMAHRMTGQAPEQSLHLLY